MNAPMKNAPTVAAVQGAEDANANVISLNVNTVEGGTEPNWLKPTLGNIPDALKQQPWAVWKAEPRPNNPDKYNKAPCCPTSGYKIGTNQPEKFGTFDAAKATYDRGGYTGVGVLLTGNGIIGVDIDDAVDTFKSKPEVHRWLLAAIKEGAYCEQSPSGSGLRLFMAGTLPGSGRKTGPLEIYDDVRFLTVTGHAVDLKTGGV